MYYIPLVSIAVIGTICKTAKGERELLLV